MTQGGATRRIRIRLSGDRAQDLRALQRWLSLEEWFTEAQAEYGLSVVHRERDSEERAPGPDGPAMGGVVTELVLILAAGVVTPIVEDVYDRAKTSARAFATNLSGRQRRVDSQVTLDDGSDDGPAESSDPQDGEGGRIG